MLALLQLLAFIVNYNVTSFRPTVYNNVTGHHQFVLGLERPVVSDFYVHALSLRNTLFVIILMETMLVQSVKDHNRAFLEQFVVFISLKSVQIEVVLVDLFKQLGCLIVVEHLAYTSFDGLSHSEVVEACDVQLALVFRVSSSADGHNLAAKVALFKDGVFFIERI